MKLKLLLIAGVGVVAAAFNACSAPLASQTSQQSASSTTSSAASLGTMSLKLADQNGNVIYSDAAKSGISLKAGQMYTASLSVTNPVSGATFQLGAKRIDVLNGAALPSQNIQPGGSATLQIPSGGAGQYQLSLVGNVPGSSAVTKLYTASVQCSNPTFTAASINGSALSVSGSNNDYSFSGAGVISSANGQAPYKCAYDPTGTLTQDTVFTDCAQVVKAYSNYVAQRTIGVLVMDSCGTVVQSSKTVNLAWNEPAMPGQTVFISAQLSQAGGLAKGDSRIDGVQYGALNTQLQPNVVEPNYSNGNFNIQGTMNYGMPSSVNMGIQIQISGITDNINPASGSGSISMANAKIKKVVYTTDQRGDESPQVQISSSSCQLTNANADVVFVTGQPCTGGTSGTNNKATVRVYGHFSCPALKNADGSITSAIAGDFQGLDDMADSCSGGGGGGGGIVPVTF